MIAANSDFEDVVYPDTSLLITEDGKPVDNLFVEKQYRLLTEPLWTSWKAPNGEPFRVLANVGLFFAYKQPPLVPDVMFATDVKSPEHPRESDSRSYFQWIVGKPPDVVIEIVSDRRGREDSEKLRAYQRIGVPFYVIFDPDEVLKEGVLRTFSLTEGRYRLIDHSRFGDLGIGLTLWDGEYEDGTETWLRWIDDCEQLIPTGKELAEAERIRASEAKSRAETAESRAETAESKAETAESRAETAEQRVKKLEDRLRAAGLSANGQV